MRVKTFEDETELNEWLSTQKESFFGIEIEDIKFSVSDGNKHFMVMYSGKEQ